MADTRILHKKAGMSAKVSALSDFEARVWVQYLSSADDFGVMPADAYLLQAENYALKNRPTKKVQAAIETLIGVGLVRVFEHQGTRYVWQPTWQSEQGVRFPRPSVRPVPPAEELALADDLTADVFAERAEREARKRRPRSDSTPSALRADDERALSCARAGNTHTNTHTHTDTPKVSEESARETNAMPAWGHSGSRRVSALMGDHRNCDPTASAACARGVCVPPKLVLRWRAQFGDETALADNEIRALVAAEVERLKPDVPIGDDPWKLWSAAWEAHYGSARQVTSAPNPHTKGNASMLAAQRAVSARHRGPS